MTDFEKKNRATKVDRTYKSSYKSSTYNNQYVSANALAHPLDDNVIFIHSSSLRCLVLSNRIKH